MNYSWIMGPFRVQLQDGNLQNVVTTVDWRRVCTQDSHTASCYGQVTCPAPNPDSFVDFAKLTEDQVVGWVEAILGPDLIATYDANLAHQIRSEITPTTAVVNPPWQ